MTDIVENFYGVYLLYCLNEQYKGRTYIGFTTDPNRRINQHNKGTRSGGAWKTNNKGPWEMVLIIHGFPNEISALRFEWAWQHPKRSRRLHNISNKQKREKSFDYAIRLMSEMLRIGPWNRLPLTIRWLNSDYIREFSADRLPPVHMPIVYGSVISKKLNLMENSDMNQKLPFCYICKASINLSEKIECLNPVCNLSCHTACLAKHFLTDEDREIIPVQGTCPLCKTNMLWGDLIRKKHGCYSTLQ